MTLDEFMKTICESEINDWAYDIELDKYIYKKNIEITIESGIDEDITDPDDLDNDLNDYEELHLIDPNDLKSNPDAKSRLDEETDDDEIEDDHPDNLLDDADTYKIIFHLCYKGTAILSFNAISVDNDNAIIPMPAQANKAITKEQYRIGRILNIPYFSSKHNGNTYNYYLNQIGIHFPQK